MDYMFFCAEIKVCPSFLLRALRIRLVAWVGHMMQLRRIYVECVPNCFIGALEIRPDRSESGRGLHRVRFTRMLPFQEHQNGIIDDR